jgi:2-hydroxycyclohexanecarboxyl-CoA dehydrogenase
MDLRGRVAFLTGGAGGIGLAMARALAEEDVIIALADCNSGALTRAADSLSGARVSTYAVDVTDRAQLAAVARRVEEDLGPVSLLLPNAGVIDSTTPARMSYELWDWMTGVNVGGVYNTLQTFLPGMIRRADGGQIVVTASEAGLAITGAGFMYHASKYAVVGLAESLRDELAHRHIGVTVVCPGLVKTSIMDNALAQRPLDVPAHSPRGAQVLAAFRQELEQTGADADDLGRTVVRAIKANQSYVHTRPQMRDILLARTAALLADIPAPPVTNSDSGA